MYVVCPNGSVNGNRKQTKQKIQTTLTLLVFKMIAILHNTLLVTFIKLLETVSKGLFRNRSPNQWSTVGGLLSVSPPEEHHERRTFCRRGVNPRTVTAVLRSIPKKSSADSFHKLYERYQQCVVKDGDYFEGQ
jgi:hypothetical protein